MIKEIIAKGGGAKDVIEKLQELLRKLDCASVEVQQALAGALLLILFAGGCARLPPGQNVLSGKRLIVTLRFRRK